jgi:hypothetical protein
MYEAPFDGVITSWGSQGWFDSMGFKVVRMGVGGAFTVLAADGPRAYTGSGGLQTYPVRFPVRQGDVLAIQIPSFANALCFHGDTGDAIGWNTGDIRPGSSSSVQSSRSDQKLPVQATIERDADGDGYGDATQDACPTDPSTHGQCPLPMTLGKTFAPSMTSGGGCGGRTSIPLALSDPYDGVVYSAPTDGVITSWAFQGGDRVDGTVTLKTFRPVGGTSYRTLGEDGPRVPAAGALVRYPTRLGVEQGDRIGLAVTGTVDCGSGNGSGEQLVYLGNPAAGSTNSYFASPYSTELSAVLEADADGDGYGDTSQDLCPTDPSTQGACATPPPPGGDDKACEKAKGKLAKAKAKLKKLKKKDAAAKKIKAAKAKVKKAKAKVKKAC